MESRFLSEVPERLVEAEEARSLGLVTEVLPDQTALLARAEALARTIGGHAPLTLQAAKTTLKRLRENAVKGAEADDMVALTFTKSPLIGWGSSSLIS